MRNLVEISNTLVPAFMSRWLWYVIGKEHKKFIDDRKHLVDILDKEKSTPKFNPKFISVVDYLQGIKAIPDSNFVKKIIDEYRTLVPSELVEKLYDPRAHHQLLCLCDGYAKVNSLIENRKKIKVLKSDMEEAAKVFETIIFSWLKEVDIDKIPLQHKHKFISETLRKTYDYVCANKGERTPQITLQGLSINTLLKLRDIGLVKSVLDIDGTTNLWFPHWDKRLGD